MYILKIVSVVIVLCLVSGQDIHIFCKDGGDSTEIVCDFVEPGIYRVEGLSKEVDNIVFNRLMNSKVRLPSQIQRLTIKSSAFDSFIPCDHVISPRSVNVYIEDNDSTELCHPSQPTYIETTIGNPTPMDQPPSIQTGIIVKSTSMDEPPSLQTAIVETMEQPPSIQTTVMNLDITDSNADANKKIIIPIVITVIMFIMFIIIFFIIRRYKRRNRNKNINIRNIAFTGSEECLYEMTSSVFPSDSVKHDYKTE